MNIDTGTDPFALFQTWYDEAVAAEINDPDAMALASVDSSGMPSVAEYWHIGDSMMRLAAFTDRNSIGRKRCGLRSRWRTRRLFSLIAVRIPSRKRKPGE